MKKPELLLPAGSRASLEAAIEGGADAVYLGAGQFNARMRAENFNGDELAAALCLARAYGVRTYVTLNTRLFDAELSDALRLAASLYEAGADALIVADMGIASLIRKHLPDLEIHASTQLSGHSLDDARALQAAGFTRMVCHREISRDSLFELCKSSPIEIEMFIHGAYCVSFSGQCLMSAVMGGRSGNRGECAQPCRQPYTKSGEKGYPISLKDMCLASRVTDIIASGAASLKIEGRQKPPEYVYGTAKIYRRLLDEGRNATAEEIEALARIFSRDGFTDGYFTENMKNMRGVRTYDDFLKMDKSKFGGLTRKAPLDITLTAVAGKPATFEAVAPEKRAVAVGETVAEAGEVAPLSEEGARKNSSRLGNTPFEMRDFRFITDGRAALTLSAINALRRSAVDELLSMEERKADLPDVTPPKGKKPKAEKITFTAEFLSEGQITPLAERFFDRIYLPFGAHSDKYDVSLPPYLPDLRSEEVWQAVKGRRVLAHGTGQLKKAREVCSEVGASFRMNIFNSSAARYYSSLGADFLTLAPEAKRAQMRDISSPSPCAAIVYGRLPLMLTLRCAISDGKCKKSAKEEICPSAITDRHGVRFPLYGMPDCTNVVFNSVPTYMADKQDELKKTGCTVYHFIFTDETPEECDSIIRAYMNGESPEDPSKIRRMQ
ncbi:MAG: U32 family peptidase [Ruminococcaceae bacterium]|nr:U32 family peptidase [Oscillospiraceae bacterium]